MRRTWIVSVSYICAWEMRRTWIVSVSYICAWVESGRNFVLTYFRKTCRKKK
jgi:hypothetical protein